MEHGTRADYLRHHRKGETACDLCKAGNATYQRERLREYPAKKRPYRYRRQAPQDTRRGNWKRAGIDPAAAAKALDAHPGLCEICGTDYPGKRNWHIDHDKTKEPMAPVRGVLCHRCNVGLGFFKDDPNILRSAILYLLP